MGWHGNLYLDEDDGGANSKKSVELHQYIVLALFCGTIQVNLLNTLDSEIFVSQSHLICTRGKRLSVSNYSFWERGGKQHDLNCR